MTNKNIVVGCVIVVLIVFGTGYVISNSSDTDKDATKPSSTPTSQNNSGKSVDLSGQQLTAIPESILSQQDITSLNLSNNQLTTLPEGIRNLKNLEILNLENNRLESITEAIGELKNLQSADFSNNRLAGLPSTLANLSQLQSLNLDGYKGNRSDIETLKSKLPNTEIKS